MTARGRTAAVLCLGLLLSAMGTGREGLYTAAVLTGLLLVFSWIDALANLHGLKVSFRAENGKVPRGGEAALCVYYRTGCFLPAGEMLLEYTLAGTEGCVSLRPRCGREREERVISPARHAGAYAAGPTVIGSGDPFGLFRLRKKLPGQVELLVLPVAFPLNAQDPGPGMEDGRFTGLTSEDPTSPEDTRPYAPGDPLKRVHWKLSARRRELTVRRFEMPSPPDTLILTDLRPPLPSLTGEEALRLKDAVLETAAAVARAQLANGSPVRLPFFDSASGEFCGDAPEQAGLLEELLALRRFDESGGPAEAVRAGLTGLGRTGAAAVISAELTPALVDACAELRRARLSVRVYFVSFEPEAPAYEAAVLRLEREEAEVCYVTPS